MKNKSKRNKIRQHKIIAPAVPKEWLYLAPSEMNLRDICQVFAEDDSVNTEIWEEAGVVELVLPDGKSIDIELGDVDPDDVWMTEQGMRSLFLVTIVPDSYGVAEKAMRKIISELGGYFCADNDKYEPEVR